MTSGNKQTSRTAVDPGGPADADVKTASGATYREDNPKPAEDAQQDGFEMLKNQHRKLREIVRETECIQTSEQAGKLQIKLADCWRRHEILHQVLFEEACHVGLQDYPPLADAEVLADLVSFLLNAHVPYEKHIDTARLRVAGRLVDKLLNDEELPDKGLIDKMKVSGAASGTIGEFFLNHMNAPSGMPGRTDLNLRHLTMHRPDEPEQAILPSRYAAGQTDTAVRETDDLAAATASENSSADGNIHVSGHAGHEKLSDAGLLQDQKGKSGKYSRRCKGRGGWWDDTDPDLLPVEKTNSEFGSG